MYARKVLCLGSLDLFSPSSSGKSLTWVEFPLLLVSYALRQNQLHLRPAGKLPVNLPGPLPMKQKVQALV